MAPRRRQVKSDLLPHVVHNLRAQLGLYDVRRHDMARVVHEYALGAAVRRALRNEASAINVGS
jgi:hypothetical protein